MSAIQHELFPKVLQVVDQIATGLSRTQACDNVGISIPTFEKYVTSQSFLVDALNDAEQRGYDALADALLVIDRHAVYGHSDPKMAKIISDNIKWLLSKRDNKRFGDRVAIDVNVTADKAITDALERAKARATGKLPVIDVTPDAVCTPGVTDEEQAELARLLS